MLEVVNPDAKNGVLPSEETTEKMLARGITDITDFRTVASLAVKDMLADDATAIERDMLALGVDPVVVDKVKRVHPGHRRYTVLASWDREEVVAGKLTGGMFLRRIWEARAQHRDVLRFRQNNAHWFLEKVELLNPKLTSWVEFEVIQAAQHASRSDEGSRTVESKLLFDGAGIGATAAAHIGAALGIQDDTRSVSHPTFVLRFTFVDTTGNRDKSFMEGKVEEKAMDMGALGAAIGTAIAAAQAGAPAPAPAPIAEEGGERLHHKTRERFEKEAAELRAEIERLRGGGAS